MAQVADEAGRQLAGIPYTLLPSKVRVPACRGDVVARAQVSAKLNRGLMCKLTGVVASAGYGKTTAVASWVSGVGRGCAVAWYAVSAQDSAPGVFWRYVCAALGEADAELDRALADLSFPDDPALLRNAISCLIVAAGALSRRVVLVLDDFHVVQDEPDIAQSVQHLLQNLPANMHLVVTSRRPLALQLARLRVAGQLMTIDENDLRFTADEAAEFFSRAGCVAPESPDAPAAACAFTSDGLARIEAYTHGWPAGCRLVAMLGDADDARGAHDRVRAGMNDYLFEEVFLALPAEQRDFLVKTSVVDSFCPSLAAALTGMSCPQAAGMAEALARGDLFIARIDQGGSESWYRYHMLFADMLATRAAALAPEELEGCRKAARDWYARHGYLDQAVSMCVALTD